jgi:hypothetical protein
VKILTQQNGIGITQLICVRDVIVSNMAITPGLVKIHHLYLIVDPTAINLDGSQPQASPAATTAKEMVIGEILLISMA